MNSKRVQSVSDEQYQRAQEWLQCPWASDSDQKLMAIAILGRRGGPEALSLLRRLLYSVQEPVAAGSEMIPADFPRGGMVLRRAAATIAGWFGKPGLQVLYDIARSVSTSPVIVEVVTTAVGGVFDRQAYAILVHALQSKDPLVRRAAVEASQLTASQFPSSVSTDFEPVLIELATLAFQREADPSRSEVVVNDGSHLARQLVARYATPQLEKRIISLLKSSQDEHDCLLAVEILSRRKSMRARTAIVNCLQRRDKPAVIYDSIAASSVGGADPALRKAASRVIAEGLVVRAVNSSLGGGRRRSYLSRRKASERILRNQT